MTKRTRLFLSVAAGILLVGLGTGLIASYGGFQKLLVTANNGPAEFTYVPADARFVAFANVKDVMASDVRKKLSQLQPGVGSGSDHFKQYTGIDIEKDIDYLVASSSPEAGGGDTTSAQDPPLVLARGRFDQARLENLAKDQGGSVEDYKGIRLLVHEDMKIAVAFLEAGLAAIGTPAAVKRAIDTKAAGLNATSNDELMRQVRDVDNADAWAVARFDNLQSRLPPEVARQLPPISWLAANGFIDSGVRGRLRVEARDEAAAKNLQDVVRGFMALARLQGSQHPELADWLNTLQLTGEGNAVSLSFSVPPEVIDALGAARAERPRAPGATRPPRPPDPGRPPAL